MGLSKADRTALAWERGHGSGSPDGGSDPPPP
jgi:hypothetical protein